MVWEISHSSDIKIAPTKLAESGLEHRRCGIFVEFHTIETSSSVRSDIVRKTPCPPHVGFHHRYGGAWRTVPNIPLLAEERANEAHKHKHHRGPVPIS